MLGYKPSFPYGIIYTQKMSNPDAPAGLANMITSGSPIEDTSSYSSNVIIPANDTVPETKTSPSDTSILVTEDSITVISEDTDVMSTTEASTLISTSLHQPDKNECYMVGGLNISKCFY